MDNTGDKQEVRRVIKRYSNRKLYDTRDSRYVTLLQIAEMVRRGEDVQIIDNTTKEDKTEVTLALAISEELKAKPRSVPLGTLRNLIQERGEKILTSLRDGPIGRLIPEGEEEEEGAAKEEVKPPEDVQPEPEREREKDRPERTTLAELVATSRHTLDQWQHAIDDRIPVFEGDPVIGKRAGQLRLRENGGDVVQLRPPLLDGAIGNGDVECRLCVTSCCFVGCHVLLVPAEV